MKLSIIIGIVILFVQVFAQDDKSNCEITFSFNIHDNQLSTFNYKVVDGVDRIASYYWDFGDGYTSQSANPQHVFLNEGTYLTCLTVVFENNCTATYCDTVVVDNPLIHPDQNYGISGYVYAGNALLPDGIIVLFRKISNQYRAISYTRICNGFYSFSNLSPTQYWLYAIPYFNVNTLFYPNYFPTYYGNKLLWQDAVPVTVSGVHSGKNIQLLRSTDFFVGEDSLTGTMFIGDSTYFEYNVYLNNWFDNSLPPQDHLNLAPNQVIILGDETGKVQRFALTNHYGRFVFNSIPRQILKLRPEKCGVAAQTYTFDLSEQNYVEFYLNPTSIVIGVNELPVNQPMVSVYPNPASDIVFVKTETYEMPTDICIELIDLHGKKWYSSTFKKDSGGTFVIPISELPAGIYLVTVKTENGVMQRKVVKE